MDISAIVVVFILVALSLGGIRYGWRFIPGKRVAFKMGRGANRTKREIPEQHSPFLTLLRLNGAASSKTRAEERKP